MRRAACGLAFALALGAAAAARGEDAPAATTANAALARVEALEARVRELEAARAPEPPPAPVAAGLSEWLGRLHPAAAAEAGWLFGQRNSIAPHGRFVIDNARFFLDADLSEEVEIGGRTAFRASSFFFEWDLVREAELQNRVGSLYLRLDGLFGVEGLNLKIGRFLIPFGEEYVRVSEGLHENPLLGFSAAAPYGWDEGVLLFGALGQDSFFEWKLALMNGDEGFNASSSRAPTLAGKATVRPLAWLACSLSGLRTGRLGSGERAGQSALEFGGTNAVPFGSGTSVPSFADGAPLAPDPSPKVRLTAVEADIVLERAGVGRLWLALGEARFESETSSSYNRALPFWVAEGVLELGLFADALDIVYLAARYSAFGTFDGSRGYSIEAFDGGGDLGFNTMRVHLATVGIGVRLTKYITVKAEFNWADFALVRGVPADLRRQAEARDYGGVGVSVSF
jgi:hypothetical protein